MDTSTIIYYVIFLIVPIVGVLIFVTKAFVENNRLKKTEVRYEGDTLFESFAEIIKSAQSYILISAGELASNVWDNEHIIAALKSLPASVKIRVVFGPRLDFTGDRKLFKLLQWRINTYGEDSVKMYWRGLRSEVHYTVIDGKYLNREYRHNLLTSVNNRKGEIAETNMAIHAVEEWKHERKEAHPFNLIAYLGHLNNGRPTLTECDPKSFEARPMEKSGGNLNELEGESAKNKMENSDYYAIISDKEALDAWYAGAA